MSDYVIIARVYFDDEAGDAERQLIRKLARAQGIGANFGSPSLWGAISPEKNCLTFEITDEETKPEFNRINGKIYYAALEEWPWVGGIIDLTESGFPEIEAFLVEVSEQPGVTHIEVDIDLAHGFPGDHSEATLEARDFCKAIMETPRRGHGLPLVNFKIVKAGNL